MNFSYSHSDRLNLTSKHFSFTYSLFIITYVHIKNKEVQIVSRTRENSKQEKQDCFACTTMTEEVRYAIPMAGEVEKVELRVVMIEVKLQKSGLPT